MFLGVRCCCDEDEVEEDDPLFKTNRVTPPDCVVSLCNCEESMTDVVPSSNRNNIGRPPRRITFPPFTLPPADADEGGDDKSLNALVEEEDEAEETPTAPTASIKDFLESSDFGCCCCCCGTDTPPITAEVPSTSSSTPKADDAGGGKNESASGAATAIGAPE